MSNVNTEVKEILSCGCTDINEVFICYHSSGVDHEKTAIVPVECFENNKNIIRRLKNLKNNSWKIPFTICEILDEDCESDDNNYEIIKSHLKEIAVFDGVFDEEKHTINIDFRSKGLTFFDKFEYLVFGNISSVNAIKLNYCNNNLMGSVFLNVSLIKCYTAMDLSEEKE